MITTIITIETIMQSLWERRLRRNYESLPLAINR